MTTAAITPTKPTKSSKSAMPGAYIELKLEHLGDGDFQQELMDLLARGGKELDAYEKRTGSLKGKCTISATITLTRPKESQEFLTAEYEVHLKIPKQKRSCMVRMGNGRLLYEPNSQSLNDKDQPKLFQTFDRFGTPKAVVDTDTGECLPPESEPDATGVAGQIPATSA